MSRMYLSQRGFTIVELMVATSVFSVIILVITVATTAIGRSYQQSIYASNTQAAASNLVDTLSQSVRFSSSAVMGYGDPVAGTATYCIGTRQILYSYGRKIDDTASSTSAKYAAVSRPNNGCAAGNILGASPALSGHKELLGKGMRLSKLVITQPSGSYFDISVRVVYGDDDLLCSDSVSDSCNPGSPTLTAQQLRNTDLRCKPGKGSEFCSAAEMNATVYRRL